MGAINKEGPWGHCWASALSHRHLLRSQVLQNLHVTQRLLGSATHNVPCKDCQASTGGITVSMGTLLQARPNMM